MNETITPVDTEALTQILTALRELDVQIDALKAQSAPLRAQARDILRGHATITLPGIAIARDVPDSIQASYDRAVWTWSHDTCHPWEEISSHDASAVLHSSVTLQLSSGHRMTSLVRGTP